MKQLFLPYDVIVIGAGHAGCEAATAAARLGAETLLITMDLNKTAQMSCNPAIGGIAKGQIVREVDALGGGTALVTDQCTVQFRMLNRSKGPAMWSPRAQCDRPRFIETWRRRLEHTPHLSFWQDEVTELLTEHGEVCGVRTLWGAEFSCRAVVLTAGTFLRGLMHIGRRSVPGGRCAEPAAASLTASLTGLGLQTGRMKTGTPVRIDARTVRFDLMERQEGEADFHHFSFLTTGRTQQQLHCWTCATNPQVHQTLREGLPDSPLYNGQIHSIGPRYCPSIETKLVTFPDRDSHPLFLEPEGRDNNELYLNGFSSSLPMDVQLRALRQIPALSQVRVYRPGYAIEYDYFPPTQLRHSLEAKRLPGLFLAGQVNGTTGYEEAAGQGLLAGANAALRCAGSQPLTLARDQAYIGVLIDDLVTKGVDEPYRMFTSRAEFRILLRQDNADARLTPLASRLGLATTERTELYGQKQRFIEELLQFCRQHTVKPAQVNAALEHLGSTPLGGGARLADLVTRPELSIAQLAELVPCLAQHIEKASSQRNFSADRTAEAIEAAEVEMKYAGYITRERQAAERMQRLEHIHIEGKFDYSSLHQLSTEARQKLTAIQPVTLAQASRIPGVSPNDVSVLLVLARASSDSACATPDNG